VANRGRVEIESLIGLFVNTLALRIDVSGRPTVGEMLQRVKKQALGAQQHQDIPFEQVVEIVRPERSLAHSPLFQVMFAWQDVATGSPQLTALRVEPLESTPHVVSKFDLTLSLQEAGDRIVGAVEYSTALFERRTVKRFAMYYLRLLEGMIDAREARSVNLISVLSEKEERQLIYDWNNTTAAFPVKKCVHQLFEEQVRRTPDAVAVEFGKATLSYEELNVRANCLAHYLRGLGVKPEARVALCVERGLEMVVGLLGILKAGGAYVPLDPAYPVERLSYMLEDSSPTVLLTQGHLAGRFTGRTALPVVDLGDAAPAWQEQPEGNPDGAGMGVSPDHLAYVIYTSGSTGQPKGVAVEHQNLNNLIQWHREAFALGSGQRSSSVAGMGFDAASWEIWPPLCVGATLVMPSGEESQDTEGILGWWSREKLDVSFLPTPLAEIAFARGLRNEQLKTLLIGGDRLRRLPEGGQEYSVVNNYGPTEATVVATSGVVEASGGAVTIGRPIGNTRIYILDEQQQPVPMGVTGELYVAGAGVARGYLNRPELTAERFLKDPFCSDDRGRMYRTGDLGRWLGDGRIEFVGRNDDQVKVRGFRIELGEIEARLVEHEGVGEAVVVAREDTPGEKRLVAYYTVGGEREVGAEELRRQLSGQLPEYMVPAAYVRLEELPLTANGKLDRKALPAPEGDAYAVKRYEAPVGEIETRLAEIWAEMLKVERVGRHDNFFELGGHSLLAVKLMERMRQQGLHADVRALFATPTLAELASTVGLEASTIEVPPNLIPVEEESNESSNTVELRL
jgi:arthrofactin-type cyclic lipopeptide synthetase C